MNSVLQKVPGRRATSMRTTPGRVAQSSVRKLSEVGGAIVSVGGLKKEEVEGYPDTDRGSIIEMANFLIPGSSSISDKTFKSLPSQDVFQDLSNGGLSEVKITKIIGSGTTSPSSETTSTPSPDSKRDRAVGFFTKLRK